MLICLKVLLWNLAKKKVTHDDKGSTQKDRNQFSKTVVDVENVAALTIQKEVVLDIVGKTFRAEELQKTNETAQVVVNAFKVVHQENGEPPIQVDDISSEDVHSKEMGCFLI